MSSIVASVAPENPKARDPEMISPEAARKSAKVAITAAVVFFIAITLSLYIPRFRNVDIKKVFEHATVKFIYYNSKN